MPAEPTVKKTPRYRGRVGNRFCQLNYFYHDMGVLIPAPFPIRSDQAAVFEHNNSILAAIKRTENAQADAMASLYPDCPKFKALMFKGRVVCDEFYEEVRAHVHQP